MNKRIQTVGDLNRLLIDIDDDTPIQVAAIPDRNGWTNQLLDIRHEDDDGIVLALSEETATAEERDLVFYNQSGEKVRPS